MESRLTRTGPTWRARTRCRRLFAAMLAQFGTIDILVANAGLQRDAPFHAMTLEQWSTVLGVNLTGQFLCARAALREFLRRGIVETVSRAAGKIICMSSVHEEIPWAGHANYAASKGGVMMMMRSLAQDGSRPIAFASTASLPALVRTPINTAAWQTAEAYANLIAARALRAHRRARGHRAGGGLARLRRFRLRGRDHPVR